jgi:hypothetical protein
VPHLTIIPITRRRKILEREKKKPSYFIMLTWPRSRSRGCQLPSFEIPIAKKLETYNKHTQLPR